MSFKENLIRLLGDLKSNSFINIKNEYIGSTISNDDFSFQLILEYYKIKLNTELLEFYHSMSSCNIEWECRLEQHPEIKKNDQYDEVVNGIIRILPVEKMLEFDTKLGTENWVGKMDKAEKMDMNDFRYFELNDDYARMGFLNRNSEIQNSPIYFITHQSQGFTDTGLSFLEYIELIEKYKGYQGWQYNHMFPESENNKRMIYYLNQIFDNKY